MRLDTQDCHSDYSVDLMRRPPRNAKRDRLTNINFFLFIYLWIGPQIWVTSMAMFFYWFQVRALQGYYSGADSLPAQRLRLLRCNPDVR